MRSPVHLVLKLLPEVSLPCDSIEYVPRYRYLGVFLDHKLNWRQHCEALRGKILRLLIGTTPT